MNVVSIIKKISWYEWILGFIVFLVLTVGGYLLFSIKFRSHAAPEFNIENRFDQTVVVYVDGYKMTRISPDHKKTFYPYDILPANQDDVTVELISVSGTVLYSHTFTFKEAAENPISYYDKYSVLNKKYKEN